ncbi:DUF6207 family protein [Streptomyces sp. NPDC087532]|uniref:DUF6207 family protein n=1 Tax=Streptomyces sp. NPDC087532 TaxID=3365795 RepID=UPI003818FD49
MNNLKQQKRAWLRFLDTGVKPIDEVHVSEPGLIAVEVVAGDKETALAAVATLGERWATSGPPAPWRVPGEPGVRVRTYVDTRAPALSDEEPVAG